MSAHPNDPWSEAQQTASFEEPWQAELFAVTVELSKAGRFTWAQWTQYLGDEIRRHPQGDAESINGAYYRQWLTALEALLVDLGTSSREEIVSNQEHWRRSYAATEHGKPIVFSRSHPPLEGHADHDHAHHHGHHSHHHHDHHHHEHGHLPRPVTVSPPIPRSKSA